MTLAAARARAKTLLAEKTLGRTHPTQTAFDDAKASFLKECENRNKPRTLQDYTRLLRRHYPFGRQAVADITPRQILQRLAPLAPSEKHHAFTAGRRFFRWCVQNHLVDRSPMENMAAAPGGRPRSRVLAEAELRAVYRTARSSEANFERIVALLILTGQRRGEIARLEWGWVNGDTVTLPADVAKNGREHTFPIGPEARALLASIDRLKGCPYVFPAARQRDEKTTVFNGWGKPKARFDRDCGVSDWTLHDLRRTFSSGMAALGIPQILVEKLLNHVSGGTQSPIAQVYNRYTYLDEMRAAVLKWEAHLTSLL
jgi:integrase